MGYDIPINFKRPYLASSIKEFWRRWHISLSTWFRDYLYFPLGGSRKGFIRAQVNTLIVFLVSGLWHGASFNFLIWGGIHGMFLVVENVVNKNKKKEKDNWFIHIIKVLITFIIIDFAWIFFRSNSINDSITIITHLFNFGMAKDLSLLGTNVLEASILLVCVVIVLILEVIGDKKDLKESFYKMNIVVRWAVYFVLLFMTIIFGIYGPGFSAKEFIYLKF
jgi:D-alanyl-lipoteichoic acid acyltransferase DltB (MBOAT superfamily)